MVNFKLKPANFVDFCMVQSNIFEIIIYDYDFWGGSNSPMLLPFTLHIPSVL